MTMSRIAWCGALALVLLATGRPAKAGSRETVVPNVDATVEGRGNNVMPFDCGVSARSMRYQQVYAGIEVGSGTITELRFRPDAEFLIAFGPTVLREVTITLSSTSAPVNGLSATFAKNVGDDVTTVFSGDLVLASDPGSDVPAPFDVAIPLSAPFGFDGTSGVNLLLDVTIPTCATTQPFDTTNAQAPHAVSRAFTDAVGADSPTADIVDAEGIVTQFVLHDTAP